MCNTVSEWAGYSIRDLTVNTILTRQARSRPDKIYVRTTDGEVLTYSQVHLLTNRIGNWLMGIDLKQGSHVAVFMENELECLLSHLALAKLGAVSIPINSSATGAILAHYLNSSDSVAVIATAD